jgi:flagellin
MASVGSISGYGIKSALIGQILQRKPTGSDFGSILMGMENAKLLEQVVNSRPRRRSRSSAASLAIADRYESSATRSRVGSQNASIGISRTSTANAALESSRDIVSRLSELSVMASDSMLTDSDRSALNAEAQALKQELSDIQSGTQFNGSPILQGSSVTTFTGEGSISTTDANLAGVNTDLASFDLSTQAGANAARANVESASTKLSIEMARSGANENRLQRAADLATTQANNMEQAASTIRESEMGTIGNLFGSELASVVNELFGFSF